MLENRQDRPEVKEVFDFLYNEYSYENCELFCPEPIYKNVEFEIENYPAGINYCNMSGDTLERKEHLLSLWTY